MGVLDDAIREHLDLKRRRGADPTEVERAERDALGPVRRAPERVAGDELEPGAAPEPGEGPENTYDNELDYQDVDEDVNADRRGHADEPGGSSSAHELDHTAAAYDQALTTEAAPPGQDEASWSYEATESEPPHLEPAAEPEHDHADRADHTVGYSVDETVGARPPRVTEPPGHGPDVGADDTGEHAVGADKTGEPAVGTDKTGEHGAPSAGDEDVLEDTPEFLQDTPDHDRLWFEQRPPRDFDFDG